jgi:GNAT superfamily N-acetyltransferase
VIRPCRDLERPRILEIVNCAAEAYPDVIPSDRWQEPYMPPDELDQELSAGVRFWGYEADGSLVGVAGIQRVRDVELIRHAYVLPGSQGHGVGGLVGTWAAAEWAIRFYRRHGFQLVAPEIAASLLKAYWTIPDRQIATSVVLAYPPLGER